MRDPRRHEILFEGDNVELVYRDLSAPKECSQGVVVVVNRMEITVQFSSGGENSCHRFKREELLKIDLLTALAKT